MGMKVQQSWSGMLYREAAKMRDTEARERIETLKSRWLYLEENHRLLLDSHLRLSGDFNRLLNHLNLTLVDTPAQREVQPKNG